MRGVGVGALLAVEGSGRGLGRGAGLGAALPHSRGLLFPSKHSVDASEISRLELRGVRKHVT